MNLFFTTGSRVAISFSTISQKSEKKGKKKKKKKHRKKRFSRVWNLTLTFPQPLKQKRWWEKDPLLLSVGENIDSSESLELFLFPYFKQDPLCYFTDVSPKFFFFAVPILKASHTVSASHGPATPRDSTAQWQLQSFISWFWFSSHMHHFYSAVIPLTSVEELLIYTYIVEEGHVIST